MAAVRRWLRPPGFCPVVETFHPRCRGKGPMPAAKRLFPSSGWAVCGGGLPLVRTPQATPGRRPAPHCKKPLGTLRERAGAGGGAARWIRSDHRRKNRCITYLELASARPWAGQPRRAPLPPAPAPAAPLENKRRGSFNGPKFAWITPHHTKPSSPTHGRSAGPVATNSRWWWQSPPIWVSPSRWPACGASGPEQHGEPAAGSPYPVLLLPTPAGTAAKGPRRWRRLRGVPTPSWRLSPCRP